MNILKKIIYYIINLFFTGTIPFLIISNIINLFLNGELVFIKNYNLKSILGLLIMTIFVKYTLQGFKGLFKDFKELWTNGNIGQRIFIILGWIFVVYGVYYRAKMSGSFK